MVWVPTGKQVESFVPRDAVVKQRPVICPGECAHARNDVLEVGVGRGFRLELACVQFLRSPGRELQAFATFTGGWLSTEFQINSSGMAMARS